MAPIITISRANVVENNSGSGGPTISFTVSLSEPSVDEITLWYRVRMDTATAADFWDDNRLLNVPVPLTIPAGELSQTLTFKINGDSLDEVDEAFWVDLMNPVNATFTGGAHVITAIGVVGDNDGSSSNLSLFVSDPEIVEGASGIRLARFEVHLSQAQASDMTFDYTTNDGTAKAGSDYTASSGTVTFVAGQTTAYVDVPVRGDSTVEATETFSLVVTPTADIKNFTSASTGLATIFDDDTGRNALPILSVTRGDVVENDSGSGGPYLSFRVDLSHASDSEISVVYQVRMGTAEAGDFWSDNRDLNVPITLTIPAGQTSAEIRLQIKGDLSDEVDESFWIDLFNPVNATLSGGARLISALGTIEDNDGSGANLSMFVSDPTVVEGNSGKKMVVFEVHLSRPSDVDLTFAYRTADGSAKAGQDYVSKSGTVTFLAGQTVASVEVAIAGDTKVEASEFFSLVVIPKQSIKNGSLDSTGVATITDDDTGGNKLPILSTTRMDVEENDSWSGGPFVSFRIDLSHASTSDVSVTYRIRTDTAQSNDFWMDSRQIDTPLTLVIPAGKTSGFITLKMNGDSLNEVDEAYWLDLFNPVNAKLAGDGSASSTIGIIRDDDGSGSNLSLFVSDATISEGNSGARLAVFEVHLSRPHSSTLTFAYKTVDGSAKAGSDYVSETGTVTFLAGQTVASVEAVVNGDQVFEANETFSLVLTPTSEIKNGTLGSTGTATIKNDDTINETLIGTSKNDILSGGDGNDILKGLQGNDRLFGDDGNDTVIGGAGADRLAGGAGIDTASYADAATGVKVNLGKSSINTGDAKGDTFTSIENLTGSAKNDVLTGDGLANVLIGGAGADVLQGAGGVDKLTGGSGADRFVFTSVGDLGRSKTATDTIYDFSRSQSDRLDFSGIDANSLVSGNQTFTFIGSVAFGGKAGQLRTEKSASDTYVSGDVNGDGRADFVLRIDDAVALKLADFIV